MIRSAAGCMPISDVLLREGACEKFEQIEGPCVTESVGEFHIGSVNRIEFLWALTLRNRTAVREYFFTTV